MFALRDFLHRTNNFLDFSSPLTETSHLKLWCCFPFKVRDFVVTIRPQVPGLSMAGGGAPGLVVIPGSHTAPPGAPRDPSASALRHDHERQAGARLWEGGGLF